MEIGGRSPKEMSTEGKKRTKCGRTSCGGEDDHLISGSDCGQRNRHDVKPISKRGSLKLGLKSYSPRGSDHSIWRNTAEKIQGFVWEQQEHGMR